MSEAESPVDHTTRCEELGAKTTSNLQFRKVALTVILFLKKDLIKQIKSRQTEMIFNKEAQTVQ